MKKAFFILCLICPIVLCAQKKVKIETIDILTLTNGKVIQGKILSETESILTILWEDITYTIDKAGIAKRSKGIQSKTIDEKEPQLHVFEVKRILYEINISALLEDDHSGTGLSFKAQHVFHPNFCLGLGISYDLYKAPASEKVLPVSLEITSFLSKKHVAPFVGLGIGYGFDLSGENQGISHAKGGYMINPHLGLMIKGNKKVGFRLFAGYKFQDAYYEYNGNFRNDFISKEVIYKRLSIGLGISF